MELNLATVHEAIAASVPDRECVVHGARRLTWGEVTDRSRRLAAVLVAAGAGVHGPLDAAAPWDSPHDHVALYLRNGVEYLESMLGAMKARCASVNVNWRYVADELRGLLVDARPAAIVYHGSFAPTLAAVLDDLPVRPLLLRVDDGAGDELLAGAVDYEAALAAADPHLDDELVASWSGDDLHLLYTGGTTGRPKGVCWRQADFLVAALGVRRADGTEYESIAEIVARARRGGLRALPTPPFMHGAANWNAISAWVAGGTVVIQDRVDHLDAVDVLDTCRRERVTSLLIVGDAFARPLIDELRTGGWELPDLRFIVTGGAALGVERKSELTELLPEVTIVDVLGSSESGRLGVRQGSRARGVDTGRFEPSETTVVLSSDLDRVLEPGDPEIGWMAQRGRVPRGYLGDPAGTAATFPVVDGVRYVVPGDRARLLADGSVELHGRDSVTINTGGEKVYAEEVEAALKSHPAVADAVVVGRPSERWGEEIVAVVELVPGARATLAELRDTCAAHLARYKLPKAVVIRDRVERSPAGKADYRWARAQATDAS
ncbi:MAG TPA: AMP-binding protein [Acidimicrobiales bacterium]|nr:AMP-binding protein [Acidimicrobiales bacterium]